MAIILCDGPLTEMSSHYFPKYKKEDDENE